MHSIQTTLGLVISSRPYGEAGKILLIFTKELGLVSVIAQGIRLEKSKLRPFTQDHSLGLFSLVRGKEFWRLTSANQIDSQNLSLREDRELVARLAVLLKRFVQGEDPHPKLFDLIIGCRTFLQKSQALSDEQFRTLESFVVFQIMKELGYIGKDSLLDDYSSSQITLELINQLSPQRQVMNQHINKALKESQL